MNPTNLYFIAIVLFCEYDFFADMKFLESKDTFLPYMNSMYVNTYITVTALKIICFVCGLVLF